MSEDILTIQFNKQNENELFLSHTIENDIDIIGMYFGEIEQYDLLSVESEKELALKIKNGDQNARQQFIERNLRLVVSIANKYKNRGLPFSDLIQEGNVGLINAVDRYDVDKGYKFSTYAFYWITQAIEYALAEKTRNIRIPIRTYLKLGKYLKCKKQLENQYNHKMTVEQIALQMGISKEKVIFLEEILMDTASINQLVGPGRKTELGYFLTSKDVSLEDALIHKNMKEDIHKLFSRCNLKPREIAVLMLRYGFNDNNPLSLSEIGKHYGITREAVRQIEMRALKKIRMSKYLITLLSYMDNPLKSIEVIDSYLETDEKENRNKKISKNRNK